MSDDLPDHTNYSLIKAVDESGNLVTVLCDSSGRIVSVMKGDYAGTMKTLAVDDKGRIQAVLTDPEDVFGNPNYIGAGELAVRLGSIMSYEHRGNVVFMDDFESTTVKPYLSGSGTGHSEARSNAHARSKDYSMKLTTGNSANDAAVLQYRCYKPPTTRIGVECAFALGSDIKKINLTCILYSGTRQYVAHARYYPQDNDLKIEIPPGVYQTIDSDLKIYEDDYLFHVWKFVFDTATDKYVRLVIDGESYDISSYSIFNFPDATAPRLYVEIQIDNNAAGNHYAYIDDVVLTQNEP